MKVLLPNKEMKELRIERAEHKRRIAQLEEQNDDLLLELASLRMDVSSVKSGFDMGGSDNSLSVIVANSNCNSNDDGDWKRGEEKEDGGGNNTNNSNATIPRRNSAAITFPRYSPHSSRRATIGVTTPNPVKSCLSIHNTLRHGSSSATHITSSRRIRRTTIGYTSPYSANDLRGSSSAHRIPCRRISSSSKDLLRICKGFVSLDDDDEAPSSGGVRNSQW
jgi:hypothetical protein